MTWERLQEKLFEFLFNSEEDYLTLDELIKRIEPVSKVWLGLEKILLNDKSNRFSYFSSISGIKRVDGYIIIRIYLWNYIVIDPVSLECLTNEEVFTLFKEEDFLNNFKEAATDNKFEIMYHFDKAGTKETIETIVKYFNEYENILTQTNYIYYLIKKLNGNVGISIKLATKKVTVSFASFSDNAESPEHVNYLFFNDKLELTGASNPTGNQESLIQMGTKIKQAKVPISAIPKFMIEEESKRLTKN